MLVAARKERPVIVRRSFFVSSARHRRFIGTVSCDSLLWAGGENGGGVIALAYSRFQILVPLIQA